MEYSASSLQVKATGCLFNATSRTANQVPELDAREGAIGSIAPAMFQLHSIPLYPTNYCRKGSKNVINLVINWLSLQSEGACIGLGEAETIVAVACIRHQPGTDTLIYPVR